MSLLFARLSLISPQGMWRSPVATRVATTAFETYASPITRPSFAWSSLRSRCTNRTHSGVKKRFRLRGSGSIKRRRAGTRHNNGPRPRQRSNHLGSSTEIKGTKIEQRIRKLLGC